MDASVQHEMPSRAMPETAYEKDDEDPQNRLSLSPATAAHGEENVVPEPGGERDVPTLPEFSNVP